MVNNGWHIDDDGVIVESNVCWRETYTGGNLWKPPGPSEEVYMIERVGHNTGRGLAFVSVYILMRDDDVLMAKMVMKWCERNQTQLGRLKSFVLPMNTVAWSSFLMKNSCSAQAWTLAWYSCTVVGHFLLTILVSRSHQATSFLGSFS